jgi:hypothetical protein
LSWNHGIRLAHRWLSMAFTVGVVLNFAAIAAWGQDPSAAWVGFLAAVPLALLLPTGLYLFLLPYAARWRSGRLATR